MVHIHNGILFSYKKRTFESILMRWMKLEPIIQRSKPETEISIQYINAYMYGISKDGNDDPICKIAKETQI